MENRLLVLASFFAKTPAVVVRHRWPVLCLLLVITVLMAWGVATRTRIEMNLDSFLDQNDPAITALDNFRTQFGSDDSLFLVYEALDGDVFSAASLRAAQALTDRLLDWRNLDASRYPGIDLSQLDLIRRIRSISTLRVQRVEGDTLRSERLVPELIPDDPAELAAIRARAMAEKDYLPIFYSFDGRFGALLLQTTFGADPVDDYVPPFSNSDISLDAAFSNFDAVDSSGVFELDFDESASIDEIEFNVVNQADYHNFFRTVRAVYADYEDTLNFYPTGNPALMSWVFEVMQDMLWLAAGMIAIFVFLLRTLFRSFSAVIWPVVTILMSLLWAWGMTVWAGFTLTTMVSLTAMLVFATGIADCVHVLSAYFTFRQNGNEHMAALSSAYAKTGLAVMVTSLTTMAGVLSLTVSDMIPIKVFGFMSALGVILAFVFTIVLLPILLSFWHPKADKSNSQSAAVLQRWMAQPLTVRLATAALVLALLMWAAGIGVGIYLAVITLVTLAVIRWQPQMLNACFRIATARPWTMLTVFGSVFLLSLYGTTQVRIDSNVAELARDESLPKIAYRTVDQHMAGAQTLVVMIDTGVSDGLMDPAVLQAMDSLQQIISERYSKEVVRTYSMVNLVKDTYQVMNQDDPAYYRLPDSAITTSQLMYLFNSANPEERRNRVSDDFSRTHITINAYNAGSWQYQQFFDELTDVIHEVFAPLKSQYPDMKVDVTGSVALMLRAMDEIARSQYTSLLLALAVISVIMVVTLGSVQAGLISVIPNLIPALLTFGVMGLLGITLDADTLLIAPVIIGVAVDDTIHFMTSYRLELIQSRNMTKALQNTLHHVGRAVMFTTLILGLGFAILSFSEYLGIAKIGIFGGIAIFTALLCDLLLLPALLTIFKPRFGINNTVDRFDELKNLTESPHETA
ncbi:MAG TPA: MMPL family transporter [Pseudohongiella sp.]|nr:MMPL family transporter [Pseudohongiella sp.]